MSRMLEEINEIPGVVAALLGADRTELEEAAAAISSRRPAWASIVARGTSDHAAQYARYLLEIELGLPTGLAAPSVTTLYRAPLRWRGALVLAFSQSGESPDVVTVVEEARRGGALTVAITNQAGSPLALVADHVIDCRAGPETAIPATKSYVAELAAVALLVGHLTPRTLDRAALQRLPATLERCLAVAPAQLADVGLAEALAGSDRALVASRGYNYATALEIALKLKETAGVFAEGYSTADLEHGPVAIAEPSLPVIFIRPHGPVGASIDQVMARVQGAGSRPWVIGVAGDGSRPVRHISLPLDLPEALSPLVLVVPGQLLAEASARRRGRDPDRLPSLTKVTRTL